MSDLKTAFNCSDSLYIHIYRNLQDRASQENEATYRKALSAAKTKKQKDACAGRYCGRWQTLFNKWCAGRIANIHALNAMALNHVDESFLLD